MLFNGIYKDKKVFLTGHTGFKGSWLLSWLNMAGADVMGYSLAPKPEHKLYGYIKGESFCHSFLHDILDYPALEKCMMEFQPDFVFHLAAQPLVRHSYENPLETFNVNIMGTTHVLNAIRKISKPCVAVIVTTDKVYHNQERTIPYRETDRLGGYDPYSSSKACAELVIDAYRNSYFNATNFNEHKKTIVAARAGNVIGGGDWAKDRIVPDIISALQNNEPVIVRNPQSVRPWQHVLEPLHAYLLLGQKLFENPGVFHNEYNFGPEPSDCLPVETMVQEAIKVWQAGTYKILKEKEGPHEAGLLTLDISRAKTDLHWRPVYNAVEAMDKTISWYKACTGENALELIEENIETFMIEYNQSVATVHPA
ncbi:MAG TPA: CDP-glucose 4,6-dehydratase [Puia sp.]